MCNNNLKSQKKLEKKEFPLCLKCYTDIYNEIYCYFKYKIIPEERFKLSSIILFNISDLKI